MRTPRFWNTDRPSPLARALAPAGALYGFGAGRRLAKTGAAPALPVLCIGNFTAGGAGKTPVTLALAREAAMLGETPAFLSRGYKGRLSGRTPVRVDPASHNAREVGDEPLLLAAHAPAFICADRLAGAQAARKAGASLVLMDDGMQNPSLSKRATIAVVDGPSGIGNGLCLPAGPLRAPMARQWPLVSALVVLGDGPPGETIAAEAAARGIPVFRADIVPDAAAAADLRSRKLLAFAGIGRPEKFFATLKAIGARAVVTAVYPDHHFFKRDEITHLIGVAKAEGLTLVTTQKDATRLDAGSRLLLDQHGFSILPVHIEWREPEALQAFLKNVLAG